MGGGEMTRNSNAKVVYPLWCSKNRKESSIRRIKYILKVEYCPFSLKPYQMYDIIFMLLEYLLDFAVD